MVFSAGQQAFADCPPICKYAPTELIVTETSVTGHYEGVNELREREFPSLAKEGCREAAGWFDQEINYLTNTTPAPIKRWATPLDSAEEGNCSLFPAP